MAGGTRERVDFDALLQQGRRKTFAHRRVPSVGASRGAGTIAAGAVPCAGHDTNVPSGRKPPSVTSKRFDQQARAQLDVARDGRTVLVRPVRGRRIISCCATSSPRRERGWRRRAADVETPCARRADLGNRDHLKVRGRVQ